ncbi:MAG: hypothetical protein Q7J21_11905 [Rugosibacter sp.]|nr:hypothetical protein [Rugosibacter sp.]
MSYLEKLKLLEVQKNSLHSPEMEPTEPTKAPSKVQKAPSVGFVGTVQGACEKNHIEEIGTDTTAAVWLVTYPDGRKAEVYCTPAATLAQVLETRPGATAETHSQMEATKWLH